MMNCQLLNLDLTILGERIPYAVHCVFENQTAAGIFTHDATMHAWQHALTALAADEPGEAQLQAAGSALFAELFHADVRDLWLHARSELEHGAVQGLRIRLTIQSPAVAALPWEYLYDADRNIALAADSSTPLVRIERAYRHVSRSRPLDATPPLRLLIAAPEDEHGLIDADVEIVRLRQALNAMGSTLLEIHELRGRFDILDLRRTIKEHSADIVHFITHGEADGLHLWRDGVTYLASAGALRATLQQTPSVKLVILNACQAGRIVRDSPFVAVAQQMLQAGVPAVIAMQSNIANDDAVNFAYHLYDELLCGSCPGAIDCATAGARNALFIRNPASSAYGIPVLWLNATSGQIFSLPDDFNSFTSPHNAATQRPAEASVQVEPFDLAELEAWLNVRKAEVDAARLPVESRILLGRWQQLVTELEGLIHQRHALFTAEAGQTDHVTAGLRKQAEITKTRALLDELARKIRHFDNSASQS